MFAVYVQLRADAFPCTAIVMAEAASPYQLLSQQQHAAAQPPLSYGALSSSASVYPSAPAVEIMRASPHPSASGSAEGQPSGALAEQLLPWTSVSPSLLAGLPRCTLVRVLQLKVGEHLAYANVWMRAVGNGGALTLSWSIDAHGGEDEAFASFTVQARWLRVALMLRNEPTLVLVDCLSLLSHPLAGLAFQVPDKACCPLMPCGWTLQEEYAWKELGAPGRWLPLFDSVLSSPRPAPYSCVRRVGFSLPQGAQSKVLSWETTADVCFPMVCPLGMLFGMAWKCGNVPLRKQAAAATDGPRMRLLEWDAWDSVDIATGAHRKAQ